MVISPDVWWSVTWQCSIYGVRIFRDLVVETRDSESGLASFDHRDSSHPDGMRRLTSHAGKTSFREKFRPASADVGLGCSLARDVAGEAQYCAFTSIGGFIIVGYVQRSTVP
jgi:hypothetical protein